MAGGRNYEEWEIEFIKNNYLNMSDEEIGNELKRTGLSIRSKRSKLNLKRIARIVKESKWGEFTNHNLLNMLKELIEKNNEVPKVKELSSYGLPSFTVYKNRFNSSWNEILNLIGVNGVNKSFSECEINYIKNNYKTKNDKEIAEKLGRSESCISSKRKFLGFKRKEAEKQYSKHDIEEIIKDYKNKNLIKDIAIKYNRSENSILYILKKENVYILKVTLWTEEEIFVLKSIYGNKDWDYILSKLPKHSKSSIITKASELKIKKESHFWSEKDVKILENGYKKGLKPSQLYEELSANFTTKAITTKAVKLNLIQNHWWEDWELDFLKDNYSHKPMDYIHKILSHRRRHNIATMAKKLNLVSSRYWTDCEDLFIENNYKTMSDLDISKKLNRTRKGVKARRQNLGLESYFYNNFGSNFPAKDGTICLSYDECIIHDYLVDRGFLIQKETWYRDIFKKDNTRRRLDWVLTDVNGKQWFVEYFGIYDTSRKENKIRKDYQEKTKKKIKDLIKYGVYDNCIFIFPSYLKNKSLKEIFKPIPDVNNQNNTQQVSNF